MADRDWMMGALAAQDEYRPLGNDPWTNTMRGTPPAPGQKPFLRFFEDRVNLTAEKRGEAPKKVLKDFIRGKAPLLTVPPIMGALAAQDSYRE